MNVYAVPMRLCRLKHYNVCVCVCLILVFVCSLCIEFMHNNSNLEVYYYVLVVDCILWLRIAGLPAN